MNSPFRPHGKFTMHVEGRLIVAEVTGPWNKELVEYWAQCAHPLAAKLAETGPHIGIAIIRNSMLCPPNALLALRQSAQYSAAKLGALAHVVVADKPVDGRDFIEPSFRRAYEGVLPIEFFYDADAARAWSLAMLRERGF